MQHLRVEAGEYVRKDSVTTQMLKIALRSPKHHCRRGNHEVIVKQDAPTPGYPDMERCEGCDRYLACQVAGRPQFDYEERCRQEYTCRHQTQRIRFLYHDTCCVEYDVDAHMITGHGTHGWSQSTNRAIDNYLEALEDCGYVTQDVRYEMLSYIRRDGKGTIDHEAPWYSTQP